MRQFYIHNFVLFYTQSAKTCPPDHSTTKTTVMICVLTPRIHICSIIQDCLLQLMQLLQFWDTKEFAMSITNNFIGTDVSLTDMTIQGYDSLGFNARSLTQDALQGQFTITTESLIPIMSYSDNFTWAKYGHHILFCGELTTVKCQLTVKCNPSLNSKHCETLITFLQTDLEACASNVLDKSSDVKIATFLKKLFLPMKGVQSSYNFDKCLETNSGNIAKEIYHITTSSNVVP
jgi:hypothetical protein